jgi:hypothetical protein
MGFALPLSAQVSSREPGAHIESCGDSDCYFCAEAWFRRRGDRGGASPGLLGRGTHLRTWGTPRGLLRLELWFLGKIRIRLDLVAA